MKTSKLSLTALSVIIFFIISCGKKHTDTITPVTGNGVFITHEGEFTKANSSISYYNRTTGVVTNNIFTTVNGRPLGDVTQSMTIYNSNGYIVVNNSQKIEVVEMNDFKSIGTITGFASPRYMLTLGSNKAYISDWNDNNIKIVNLSGLSINSKTIPTGNSPEQLVQVNNVVYVANSGDSTITVINPSADTVITTIKTPDAPTAIRVDNNNMIWVLCSGSYGTDYNSTADDTPANLIKIDPATNSIKLTIQIGVQGDHPDRLAISQNKDALFYDNNGIFTMSITATSGPSSALITKDFYGLDVDPTTNIIYAADAGDFVNNGYVFRYKSTGQLIDSFQVGIVPAGFAFN